MSTLTFSDNNTFLKLQCELVAANTYSSESDLCLILPSGIQKKVAISEPPESNLVWLELLEKRFKSFSKNQSLAQMASFAPKASSAPMASFAPVARIYSHTGCSVGPLGGKSFEILARSGGGLLARAKSSVMEESDSD